jgi:3-oxoacyl-[acyl-carrier protein] reductase
MSSDDLAGDLANKVVLVTGAGTGIGAAVARGFGARACRVVVHYRSSSAEAAQVAADIEVAGGAALLVQADVTDTAQIANMIALTVERFGRIDVLVNNAGDLVARRSLDEASDDYIAEVFNLNARSALVACREVAPVMRRQGGGAIINVTSIAARHGGAKGAVVYGAAKAFVSSITRGLAKELAPDRIRVNAVSPGVITTPIHDRHTPAAQLESFRAAIPMQRLGTADECVGAFLYLASEVQASYVTGQIIEVNGGQYMP